MKISARTEALIKMKDHQIFKKDYQLIFEYAVWLFMLKKIEKGGLFIDHPLL